MTPEPGLTRDAFANSMSYELYLIEFGIAAQATKFKEAYMEWSDKTDWVQEQRDSFSFNPLGMHRADIMRKEIEHLRRVIEESRPK